MKLFGIILFLLIAGDVKAQIKSLQTLFNGKDLPGWETYLDADQRVKGSPIGLNKDPNQVFSAVTEDEKPVIRISGETFKAISTLDKF